MLTIAQKTIFFFHSLESSFDLQSNKKIGVGHQPNPPCKSFNYCLNTHAGRHAPSPSLRAYSVIS